MCVFVPSGFFFASKNNTGLLPEELEIFTDLFEKLRRWGGWEVKQSSEICDGRGRQWCVYNIIYIYIYKKICTIIYIHTIIIYIYIYQIYYYADAIWNSNVVALQNTFHVDCSFAAGEVNFRGIRSATAAFNNRLTPAIHCFFLPKHPQNSVSQTLKLPK